MGNTRVSHFRQQQCEAPSEGQGYRLKMYPNTFLKSLQVLFSIQADSSRRRPKINVLNLFLRVDRGKGK